MECVPPDLIDFIVPILEELEIPYAIGGSVAAMAYGDPRTTNDLDVVVELAPEDVPLLLARFPRPQCYHDEQAAREAVRSGGQFNIIFAELALKIDVYVAADPIARLQIERAVPLATPGGLVARFSAPEELIVKKLGFYDFSGSERHLRDIAAMLRHSAHLIDRERITRLAAETGLGETWRAVLQRVDSA